MKRLGLLLWLLLAGPLMAQTITLPEKVSIPKRGLVIIRATALDADSVRWWTTGGIEAFPDELIAPKPGVFFGFVLEPGVYHVGCIVAKTVAGKAVISQPQYVEVTVGTPVPPVPVTVTLPVVVGQKYTDALASLTSLGLVVKVSEDKGDVVASMLPVAGTVVTRGSTVTLTTGATPVPPSPAPIPAAGLRVLIIEETAERGKLKAGQLAAIFGQTFRDQLRAKCVKDAENANGAFRIWDKDVSADAESKLWQDALKRPRTSLPWLIVSNPDKGGGYEGPLPEKIEDTIALLAKFGG